MQKNEMHKNCRNAETTLEVNSKRVRRRKEKEKKGKHGRQIRNKPSMASRPHLVFTHWSAPKSSKGFRQPTSEAELLEKVDEEVAQAHKEGKVKLYPLSEMLQALYDTDENKGSSNSFHLPWCEKDTFFTTLLDSASGLHSFAVSLFHGFLSNDKDKKPRKLICNQGNQCTSGPLKLNLFENGQGQLVLLRKTGLRQRDQVYWIS